MESILWFSFSLVCWLIRLFGMSITYAMLLILLSGYSIAASRSRVLGYVPWAVGFDIQLCISTFCLGDRSRVL